MVGTPLIVAIAPSLVALDEYCRPGGKLPERVIESGFIPDTVKEAL
ncbi:MAG: hypothetical protein IJR14_11570 [Synergistaceae bacterium]|nr:hypothetical protein [Synergistaceae bacterium]